MQVVKAGYSAISRPSCYKQAFCFKKQDTLIYILLLASKKKSYSENKLSVSFKPNYSGYCSIIKIMPETYNICCMFLALSLQFVILQSLLFFSCAVCPIAPRNLVLGS